MQIEIEPATLKKLCEEDERLATFKDWPLQFIKKEALAHNGFFYHGSDDSVICIFCGVEIGHWEEGDDPETEHRKFSPNCGMFVSRDATRTTSGEDEHGCVIGRHRRRNYNSLEARFLSFKDWPISMKQSPKDMAHAGFYYLGKGDKVVCFSCGLGLNQWEEHEEPWVEHAKWNPECNFVIEKKGPEFIKAVQESEAKKKEAQQKNELSTTSLPVNEQLLCSVCKSEPRSIMSMPCRHLATCKCCNAKLITCPICRADEHESVEVIIP